MNEVPHMFSVPWDVYEEEVQLLSRADCTEKGVNISVGTEKNGHYVWHEIYITKDNKTWQKVNLTGNTQFAENLYWFIGSAEAMIEMEPEQMQEINYIASYSCDWREDGTWRCGCRSAEMCQEIGTWSLQKFIYRTPQQNEEEAPNEENSEEISTKKDIAPREEAEEETQINIQKEGNQ